MPTRAQYRQAAARQLGALLTGTATAASTTALLEATGGPFKSTISQNERFEHWLIHRPAAAAADRVRTVATGGYNAAAGQFTPDQVWSAAPAAGEAFELTNMLDADDLHRLVNAALALVPVTVEVTFAPASATARRHALSAAAPWLTDPDDVYQVGYLAPADARADVDPFARVVRGQAVERGGVVYLEGFSANPTDAVYVLAARPADTYCRASGGAFGDLTAGLTAETDEGPVEEDVVAAGVKMLAWDEFRELYWPGEDATAERKVAQAADRFWSLVRDRWREPARRFTPRRAWGPAPRMRTPV